MIQMPTWHKRRGRCSEHAVLVMKQGAEDPPTNTDHAGHYTHNTHEEGDTFQICEKTVLIQCGAIITR